jgi:hypothetical protein
LVVCAAAQSRVWDDLASDRLMTLPMKPLPQSDDETSG